MISVKYLKSIDDITNIISEQEYDGSINRNRSTYLYRGLPNANYSLETSLKRNCKNKQSILEKSILRNFTKYAAINDPQLSESIWRQMIIGQHHGLPTRLLDWTYSPLIGIHFSTSGEDLSQMGEHDAVLWKIDINEINNLLPYNYQCILNQECAYLFTIDMLNSVANNIDTYDNDMKDSSMILVEPPSIDQRIINQYSYFSIIPSGIKNVEDFFENRTINTTKYIINKDLKWRVRDMLDQMNINERICYPGLDGLTSWLKRHYYVK